MIKKISVLIVKAVLLYLLIPLLWVDLVLLHIAMPRFMFESQPFFQSAGIVVAVFSVISIVWKSKTAILWAVFCLAYSGGFLLFPRYAAAFIGFFFLVGAISFFYRNKFTEPLLVMLLVIAGAWSFLTLIYSSYLLVWAQYVTGLQDFDGALLEGVYALKGQLIRMAFIIPAVLMYFLGKQTYTKFYPVLIHLRQSWRARRERRMARDI